MVLFFIIYMWERSFENLHAAKKGSSSWSRFYLRVGKSIDGHFKLLKNTNDNRLEWENFSTGRMSLPSKQFINEHSSQRGYSEYPEISQQ